jgi:hypothetical protein
MMDSKTRFLIEHNAIGISHSSSTLLNHLAGTRALLEAWGAPREVCDAGLYHAVYGTESYSNKLLPPELRSEVRAVIGDAAEFLAYAFGAMKKSSFYANLDREAGFSIQSRFDGSLIALGLCEFAGLCHISVANWLEQRSRVSPADRNIRADEFRKMRRFLNSEARKALDEAYEFTECSEPQLWE